MSENEKTAVAALISVILRRKLGRIIDVKWLIKNEDYAREIIMLSRDQGLEDLTSYANNLENLIFGAFKPTVSTLIVKPTLKAAHSPSAPTITWDDDEEFDDRDIDVSKYIGHLR